MNVSLSFQAFLAAAAFVCCATLGKAATAPLGQEVPVVPYAKYEGVYREVVGSAGRFPLVSVNGKVTRADSAPDTRIIPCDAFSEAKVEVGRHDFSELDFTDDIASLGKEGKRGARMQLHAEFKADSKLKDCYVAVVVYLKSTLEVASKVPPVVLVYTTDLGALKKDKSTSFTAEFTPSAIFKDVKTDLGWFMLLYSEGKQVSLVGGPQNRVNEMLVLQMKWAKRQS
jgi:hypothetical protein